MTLLILSIDTDEVANYEPTNKDRKMMVYKTCLLFLNQHNTWYVSVLHEMYDAGVELGKKFK